MDQIIYFSVNSRLANSIAYYSSKAQILTMTTGTRDIKSFVPFVLLCGHADGLIR
jgi:hypothetical protein